MTDEPRNMGGPGWSRYKARLGPARMEEMRQQVLREQQQALKQDTRPQAAAGQTDRESYSGYPKPRAKSRRRP